MQNSTARKSNRSSKPRQYDEEPIRKPRGPGKKKAAINTLATGDDNRLEVHHDQEMNSAASQQQTFTGETNIIGNGLGASGENPGGINLVEPGTTRSNEQVGGASGTPTEDHQGQLNVAANSSGNGSNDGTSGGGTPVGPGSAGQVQPIHSSSNGVSAQEVKEIFKSMLPMFMEAFMAANSFNGTANENLSQSGSDAQGGEHQANHHSPDGVDEHPDLGVIDMTKENTGGDDGSDGKTRGKRGKKSKVTKKQREEDDDTGRDEYVGSSKRQKLPKPEGAMWIGMAARITGSLAIIAGAISQGLAVVATSRLASSDKVKEGALLLTASYDDSGDMEIELFQLLFDDSLMKLFKVASSNTVTIKDSDLESQSGIEVMDIFQGYWLSKRGWDELKAMAEGGYFNTTSSVVTPWFADELMGEKGDKPSFMKMLQGKPVLKVLKGNPEWYHRVSPDIIARSKKNEEIVDSSGEKALKSCKNPDRLELKGMNMYILDIISIAPEYARNNSATELCRQFTAKFHCPVCPALTTMVAKEWLVLGNHGLRYFEDLGRIYGPSKARLRSQQYTRSSCDALPLNKEFTRLFEEDKRLFGILELPLAEQATHRYVTLIAMAYQMRLSFQEGMHMAVERLFAYLAGHDLGIQSEAMQQLITSSTYQLFVELDDYRIQVSSFGRGDRKYLVNHLETIPDLAVTGQIHGLWEHLRVKDVGSAAAMLMKASKTLEVHNEEKVATEKVAGAQNKKPLAEVTDRYVQQPGKNEKIPGKKLNSEQVVGSSTGVDAKIKYCAYFNSKAGCKYTDCPHEHKAPEKGSQAWESLKKLIQKFRLTPSKDLLANK